MKFDNNCDVIFMLKIKIMELRYSWNKCCIIYRTNTAKNDVALGDLATVI